MNMIKGRRHQGSIMGDFCLIMMILFTAMGLFSYIMFLFIRSG